MAVTKKEVTVDYANIPPKIEKVSQELSCKLTDLEWQNRANELADAHRKTEASKENKKSVVADLNASLKIAEAQETKLANIVANRRELREVTVDVLYDYGKGLITKTRTDTKEVIDTREMTTSERQASIFEDEVVDANDVIEQRHEEE